jgi:hypothetical protein
MEFHIVRMRNIPLKKFKKEERTEELYNWIKNLYDNEYKEIMRIWTQIPPDTWTMYNLMGLRKLREQVALKEAYNKFRAIWEKRYAKTTEETVERLPH